MLRGMLGESYLWEEAVSAIQHASNQSPAQRTVPKKGGSGWKKARHHCYHDAVLDAKRRSLRMKLFSTFPKALSTPCCRRRACPLDARGRPLRGEDCPRRLVCWQALPAQTPRCNASLLDARGRPLWEGSYPHRPAFRQVSPARTSGGFAGTPRYDSYLLEARRCPLRGESCPRRWALWQASPAWTSGGSGGAPCWSACPLDPRRRPLRRLACWHAVTAPYGASPAPTSGGFGGTPRWSACLRSLRGGSCPRRLACWHALPAPTRRRPTWWLALPAQARAGSGRSPRCSACPLDPRRSRSSLRG